MSSYLIWAFLNLVNSSAKSSLVILWLNIGLVVKYIYESPFSIWLGEHWQCCTRALLHIWPGYPVVRLGALPTVSEHSRKCRRQSFGKKVKQTRFYIFINFSKKIFHRSKYFLFQSKSDCFDCSKNKWRLRSFVF